MALRKVAKILAVSLLLSACSAGKQEGGPDAPAEAEGAGVQVTATLANSREIPPGASEFRTDFSIHSISYDEILSGGPPKDGIPAIDHPKFVSVSEADSWLQPLEPVILVQVGPQARAYPIKILIWHEIVNDQIRDAPLLVTFCPLCNTAIVFERTVDGTELNFGTTGRLRFSNLIMYDRLTESWWQQATGEAIAGKYTGEVLQTYPATIVAWQDFRQAFPSGDVLSLDTGYSRNYGSNPYIGYDNINSSPFLYSGPTTPGAMPPMARVLTLDLNGDAVAFPYEILAEVGVVNETVGGQAVAVFWQPGVASPLDATTVGAGQDVGTAAAFSRQLGDKELTYAFVGGVITDDQTGSVWDIFGRAIDGQFAGSQLEPVVSINHFWFSWAAFKPETRIYQL